MFNRRKHPEIPKYYLEDRSYQSRGLWLRYWMCRTVTNSQIASLVSELLLATDESGLLGPVITSDGFLTLTVHPNLLLALNLELHISF